MSDNLIGPLERLGDEIERMARAGERGRGRLRGRRPALVLALVAGALLLAAAALAATTGWLTGAPVRDAPGMRFAPNTGLGRVVPGSVRLTALRVTDPGGGPPWGLRTLRTTRRLGCVQVGRVVDGQLGVLGQDGAFRDDGRFHAFAPDTLTGAGCLPLDADGHAFVAVSHSGMPASGLGTACLATPYVKLTPTPQSSRPPQCETTDLRNVVFGVLGPRGRAVTWRDGASERTQTVDAADEGAYLVVTRPSPEHPPTGRWLMLGTPATGLTSVRYTDGSTCAIVSARRLGGARPCPAKGYAAAPLAGRDVLAPVTATFDPRLAVPLTGPPGRQRRVGPPQRRLVVAFRAPVATPDARSYYTVAIEEPRGGLSACQFSMTGGSIARRVRAGEAVRQEFWLPPSCRRRVKVTVRLHRTGARPDADLYAGGLDAAGDALVGRTTAAP